MTTILTEAMEMMAERHAAWIEKQLRAAWRADYDYLYRYIDHGPPRREAFIPSNDQLEHFPGAPEVIEYNLRGLTGADLEEARDP